MKSSIAKQLHSVSIWHLRYRSVGGTAGTLQPRMIHHRSLNVLCFPTAVPHLHDLTALFRIWLEFYWIFVFTFSHCGTLQYSECVVCVCCLKWKQWNSRLLYWFILVWWMWSIPGLWNLGINCWRCIVCGVVIILNCFILHYIVICSLLKSLCHD